MNNQVYNLPSISFVAGSSETFIFYLYTKAGHPFDASDCTGNFALLNYTNKEGAPLLSRSIEIVDGDKGYANAAKVELLPTDTVDYWGKYIYQLTLSDNAGNISIPGQGLIMINKNLDRNYITKS